MKKRIFPKQFVTACVILMLAVFSIQISAQDKEDASGKIKAALGTAFTYQGVLKDAGAPATGDYDLKFTLYNVKEGGTPLPGTTPVTLTNVSVEKGLFTVELDFGDIYQNQQLYLEIGVRPGGSSDSFTTLSPRQAVTPVPQARYAIQANNAATAQSVSWDNVSDKPDNLSWRRIYVPASAMNFTSGSDISTHEKGLRWPNTSQLAGFGVPQPVDWDSTKPFKVTLYFALHLTDSPGFVQWRLHAGGSDLNLSPDYPDSGWDQIYYGATQDASLLAYGNAGGHFYLMKSQSWESKWSSTYHTWYFGQGVNTGNNFIGNAMWFFYFRRGASIPNDETYTGNMYVVGADITYPAVE